MPVDEENHLERDEGKLGGEPGEISEGQFTAFAREGADENFSLFVIFVDVDAQARVGQMEAEIEIEVHRTERRDIVFLGQPRLEVALAPGCRRHEEGLQFAERVAHLDHAGVRGAVGTEAEVDRDRIEHVAEHAREAEHRDRPVVVERTSGTPQEFADIVGDRPRLLPPRRGLPGPIVSILQMVPVAQAVKVRAVDTEDFQRARHTLQLVEVEMEVEDTVSELVPFRAQAPVEDVALVEARIHSHGSSPQTARAH